ncbi:MAG: DUF3891 family protein [Planctomycetaceae bacterium]|jgi:hypothetical protein|nr:DUF3891 family protein [Planctomycetaceae bacterium]
MLKSRKDDAVWMVSQPDHSQLAGYFAAHWGNETFAKLGGFTTPVAVADPERLRDEAVLAIAEHDNGWWEWEATPSLSADDGLPANLSEVLRDQQAGMDRWRIGLGRFPRNPMVNLLISSHAHALYAVRALAHPDPAITHPLFWKGAPEKLYPGSIEAPLAFMADLEKLQQGWTDELRADPTTAAWIEPATLSPLKRMVQICDGISLWLCSALIPPASGEARGLGDDAFELHEVPRRAWTDRGTITVTPLGGRRVRFDPYPFDVDPLPVLLPARVVELPSEKPRNFQSWWHARQPRLFEYSFVSAK